MIALRRLFAAAALAVAACGAGAAEPGGSLRLLMDARLTDLDGKPAVWAGLRERPLVVNFWARWCGPCRVELPWLVEARAKYRELGVEVLGVAIEKQGEAVRAFARVYGVVYPIVLAREDGAALMRAMGNEPGGLPFTLAFDRHGKEVFRKLGAMTREEIDAAFAAAAR